MGARSRRGGGGFGVRKAPPRPAARPAAPPARQAPTAPAPMQQSSGGGMLSGIGSTIAQGMAFGTGSAIAHAVGAVAGSMSGGGESAPVQAVEQPVAGHAQQQLTGPCGPDKQMFFECLQVNQGDQQSCAFLFQNLQECQRNQSQMSFQ